MSRFARASHVIWHCQYHVVWVPKYRYRILQGPVGREVYKCVMIFSQQLGCEVVELNVQADHVHLLVKVPPKLSVSGLMGILKGRTVIGLFSVFPFLKKRPYWGMRSVVNNGLQRVHAANLFSWNWRSNATGDRYPKRACFAAVGKIFDVFSDGLNGVGTGLDASVMHQFIFEQSQKLSMGALS